jgi:hypothetical protein
LPKLLKEKITLDVIQRRRFLKIGQSETIIACGGHVC